MQQHSSKPANAFSSTSDEIIPLDDGSQEVSLNIDEWRKSVIRKFMKTCKLCDNRYGIASCVMPLQDWQELPGHIVGPIVGPFLPPVVEGTSKPRVRLSVINDADTGGRLEKKKVNNKRFEEVTAAVAECRDLLIESLGEVIAKALEIRDDSFGQITSTCLQIMNWVTNEYGTLATTSISKIIDDLSDPLDYATPVAFRAHCSKFSANRKLLEDSENDLPEFLYVKFFNYSCSHFPAIVKLQSRYTLLCVEVVPAEDVTQRGIATYVQRLLSKLTPAQIMETTEEAEQTFSAKSFSATAPISNREFTGKMSAALAAITSKYNAEIAALDFIDTDTEEPTPIAAAVLANTRIKVGGTSKSAAKPAEHTTPNHYCYYHGYNTSHDGMTCSTRLKDPTYTIVMKKARTHDAPALKALKLIGSSRPPRSYGSNKK